MGGLKLLEEARSAGLKLRAEGDRLIIRGPKSAEPIAKALLDRKAEILLFLQEHPAATIRPTPKPRQFYYDGREEEPEAVRWLRRKLATGPQRIGDLMQSWCEPVQGRPSQDISARIDLLTDARTDLDVETFTGHDGKFWWRLPVVSDAWPCPHCGQPATIDDVDWSADGKRLLTMWRCDSCEVVAVTPNAIKEPPTGWVKRTEQ